jgi:hypothetical protein
VCAWPWERFISEVVSQGNHQGTGHLPRIAAVARRGSRGRHGGGAVTQGVARWRPSLKRRRLEESLGGLSAVYLPGRGGRGVAAFPEITSAEATGVRLSWHVSP